MSTIQTNSITDAAGTGAPDFPNGINAATALIAKVDDTERARITSDGDLLVGKTTADGTTSNGVQLMSYGELIVTATDPTSVAFFTRKTTEGDIIRLRRDTNVVGNIGVGSGELFVDGATGDCGIQFGGFVWKPRDNGATADNIVDIGNATFRFDDIYATNNVINTSDRNEKQDIEELSEAERRVAVACKGLMRKYRWKDAVAEKGDNARIHFGIIAQDLQDAFEAEGLDAGRYAMFISSTWWEHDGKIYDTAEEAPEGATERTRLGVRYPELLAFIIAVL